MINLRRFADVLQDLYDVVSTEPGLAAFVDFVVRVRDQASALARGGTSVTRVEPSPTAVFPTQQLAEREVSTLSRIEPLDGDEEPSVARAYALININVNLSAVAEPVMRDFPAIVRRYRS